MERFLIPRRRSEAGSSLYDPDDDQQPTINVQRAAEEATRAADDERAEPVAPPPPPVAPRLADGSFAHVWTPNERRECVMYVEDCVSGVVPPQRTAELCLWDMQPFAGTPFPYPVRYDARERKLLVMGYTCSVSCALALANSRAGSIYALNLKRHILELAMDYFGATYSSELVRPAPPREKLSYLHAQYLRAGESEPMAKAIHEFRAGSEALIFHQYPAPPFIRVTQRIDEEILQRERDDRHRQRLELMTQQPRPIACTQRGRTEQRKYVLARRTGALQPRRGTIDTLLGLQYRTTATAADDDDDDDDDDE